MFMVTPCGSRSSVVKFLYRPSICLHCQTLAFGNHFVQQISRSEMLSPYSWLIKIVALLGATPTKPFRVTWVLQELNSLEFNRKVGRHLASNFCSIDYYTAGWMEEYSSLKLLFIVALRTSLLGHTFIQERQVLLSVDCKIPNKWPWC